MTINDDAVAHAAAMAKAGTYVGVDFCLRTVRLYFDGKVPSMGGTAYQAWQRAGGAAGPNTHTAKLAPAGVPYFFMERSGRGAGHVVLTDHYDKAGDLWVWSTDFKRKGRVDLVRARDIAARWNMRPLGWSETLNGVRVYPHTP